MSYLSLEMLLNFRPYYNASAHYMFLVIIIISIIIIAVPNVKILHYSPANVVGFEVPLYFLE